MTRSWMVWLLGVTSLAALACGGGSGGSCAQTQGTGMVCIDYGSGYTMSSVQQSCTAAMGTYSAGGCSATGRVGRCAYTISAGGSTVSATTNFYPPVTLDIAMQACSAMTTGGVTATFTPN